MKRICLVALVAACGGTTTSNPAAPQSWTGKVASTLDLPSGTALLPDSGKSTRSAPQGIAAIGGNVYVVLTNLAPDYTAGGPGLVVVIDPITNAIQKTVSLGACRDPGFARADGSNLIITCAGDFSGSAAGGAGLAIYDTTTDTAIVIDTGAAPGTAVRAGGEIFIGDAASGGLLRVDAVSHVVQNGRGGAAPIMVCPANSKGLAFVADLVDTGSQLLAACFNTNQIVALNRVTGQPIADASATVSDGPVSLAWDGKDTWVASSLANSVDRVSSGATLSTSKSAIDLTGGGTAKAAPQQVVFADGAAYIVDSGTNNVVKFDPEKLRVLAVAHLEDGSNPYNLAVVAPDVLYVTENLTNKVARVEFHAQ